MTKQTAINNHQVKCTTSVDTSSPRRDRSGERGAAMIAVLVLFALVMVAGVGASQMRVTAMRGQEQQQTKIREKWQARSAASNVAASLRVELPKQYERDLQQARGWGRGVSLPSFDLETLSAEESHPFARVNVQTGVLERTVTPASSATSLLGQSSEWATARARMAEQYAAQHGYSSEVVKVFAVREIYRRSISGGVEPSYALTYTIDARGGDFYRVRPTGEIVLGPNDTTCGTSVSLSANPTTVVRGNSTTLTAIYGRAKRLRVRNSAGTVVFDQSVTDEYNQRNADFLYSPTATDTYQVEATGGGTCSATSAPVTVIVTDPVCPAITSFAANPASIIAGGSSLISWNTSDAVEVRLNGVLVAASGSMTVSPAATTTYTLTVVGAGGYCPSSAQTTVTVTSCPTIQYFEAIPSTITRGDTSLLRWNVLNVGPGVVVTLDGAQVPAQGTLMVQPSATTLYRLRVTGPGGCPPQGRDVTVTVGDRPCPGIVSFASNLSSVQEGENITLSWNVSNVTPTTTIRLSGGGLDEIVAASGTRTVRMTTQGTYTFQLTVTSTLVECSTPDTRNVTVEVTPYIVPPADCPSIQSFVSNTACATAGGTVTLSWNATATNGSPMVRINGAGNYPLSGSASFTINAATTFTLSITLASCPTVTSSVFVDVSTPAPVINSYTASPTTPLSGESVSLMWNISGAVSADINGTSVNPTTGSVTVTPAGTTDYVLTARSGGCNPQTVSQVIRIVPRICPVPRIDSFTAAPPQVVAGLSTTLSWNISNLEAGASITLAGPNLSRTVSSVGSLTVTPPSVPGQYNYTLSVANPCNAGYVVQLSVVVEVIPCPAPQIISFRATPASVTQGAGGFVNLSWQINDPSGTGLTVAISPTVGGGLSANGSVDINAPAVTTTYTLTVTNGCGVSVSSQVSITVTVTPTITKGGNLARGGTIGCDTGNATRVGLGFPPVPCIQWRADVTATLNNQGSGTYVIQATKISNADNHALFYYRHFTPYIVVYGAQNNGFCFAAPYCYEGREILARYEVGGIPYLNFGDITVVGGNLSQNLTATIRLPSGATAIGLIDAGGPGGTAYYLHEEPWYFGPNDYGGGLDAGYDWEYKASDTPEYESARRLIFMLP